MNFRWSFSILIYQRTEKWSDIDVKVNKRVNRESESVGYLLADMLSSVVTSGGAFILALCMGFSLHPDFKWDRDRNNDSSVSTPRWSVGYLRCIYATLIRVTLKCGSVGPDNQPKMCWSLRRLTTDCNGELRALASIPSATTQVAVTIRAYKLLQSIR